jgi:hypothetical protein
MCVSDGSGAALDILPMSDADRKRAEQRRWTSQHRARARLGQKVLKPVVTYYPFIEACLDSELLTEEAALDENKVSEAAGTVLMEWMRRWRKA